MKQVVLFSGGPDSIFLTNFLLKKNSKSEIILLYVNYHWRDKKKIAEQLIVRKYAKKNKLKLIEANYTSCTKKHNFQTEARRFRYSEAIKIANQYKTKIIITGHQMNDFFETLEIQKNRKGKYDYYGISSRSHYKNNYVIKRPILKYSRKKILKNLQTNNQKYYFDKSNIECIYLRNRIRKNMSRLLITDWILFNFLCFKNLFLFHRYSGYQKINNNILNNGLIDINRFNCISEPKQKWILRKWIYENCNKCSTKKLNNIYIFIKKNSKINNRITKKFTISFDKQLIIKNEWLYVNSTLI